MSSDHIEFSKVSEEFREFDARMRDPLVVGALLHKLAAERENANRLMLEISAKLDRIMALEEKVARLEKALETKQSKKPHAPTASAASVVLLPEVDEKIIAFIKSRNGMTNAAQVQAHFHYKGRNAASSRLHALFEQGLLEKKQVGKTVYYLLSSTPSPPTSRVTG